MRLSKVGTVSKILSVCVNVTKCFTFLGSNDLHEDIPTPKHARYYKENPLYFLVYSYVTTGSNYVSYDTDEQTNDGK